MSALLDAFAASPFNVETSLADSQAAYRNAKALARLRELGVPESAIVGPKRWDVFGEVTFDSLCLDAIVDLPGNRFEFARLSKDQSGARRSLLVAVRDEIGEAVDIAAFGLDNGPIRLWSGSACVVDQWRLSPSLWPRLGEDLVVFASPLAWLRAGRAGIVVIDAKRARLRLEDARPIVADSESTFWKLERELAAPPSLFMRPTRRAAA